MTNQKTIRRIEFGSAEAQAIIERDARLAAIRLRMLACLQRMERLVLVDNLNSLATEIDRLKQLIAIMREKAKR